MRFDERWIPPQQLAALAALAQSTNALPGEVIEIGSWQGLSTVPLANAVHPATLHVVDHWQGDEHIHPSLTARDNYGIFQANMAEGTQGNYRVWKMDWRDFIKCWDGPIRFLHLDATHTTREVADNLAALLPYASDGAIFAGDDWPWPSVQAGVREVFDGAHVFTQSNMWWVVVR